MTIDRPRSLGGDRFKIAFERTRRDDRSSIDSGDYYYTNRELDHYNRLLPRFDGRPFLDILRSRIDESSGVIDVLDLGCGQGRALAKLLRDFPGRLRATGIAATDLRQHAPNDLQPFLNKIDLRLGDLHSLGDILGGARFDIIISVKTFEHLEEPEDVAQQCRELLKPQGLALIEGPFHDWVLPSSQGGWAEPINSYAPPLD